MQVEHGPAQDGTRNREESELIVLATDPETGAMHKFTPNGMVTACQWFVRGIPAIRVMAEEDAEW
jgi:hypothetical protein